MGRIPAQIIAHILYYEGDISHEFSFYLRLSASSADSPDAFSTFHHLKRFREGRQKIAEFIERIYRKENINPQDLWMGSRIKRICQIGAQIVYKLVENFGISLEEVARQVGISTFAISEALLFAAG